MLTRIAVILTFIAASAFGGDWNPRQAAQYMDGRQKAWFAWPNASRSGVVCVSCHTGLPYLLARPALRRSLGETAPTLYEAVLLDGLRATVVRTDADDLLGTKSNTLLSKQVYGAQSVLATLFLAIDDAQRGGGLSPEGEKAFDRMWSLQVKTGKNQGGWLWSDFDLDPWETADSAYYGSALGALATGVAPAGYQSRPQIRENVAALTAYLRGAQKTTPLHNRLILLWASAKLRDLLPDAERQAIVDEVWRKQQDDGGWTLESLGEWKKRPEAPPAVGSNSYATGLVAFTLEQAGTQRSTPGLARALAWLRAHQDRETGSWAAESMNHRHDAGSIPEFFMRDAATGFASLALIAPETSGTR
jgi:squalene-hopene/tetraprenyl-beta-curcumene cyclase